MSPAELAASLPWAISDCRTDATIRIVSTRPGFPATIAECGPIGFGAGAEWVPNAEGLAIAAAIVAAVNAIPSLLLALAEAREYVDAHAEPTAEDWRVMGKIREALALGRAS